MARWRIKRVGRTTIIYDKSSRVAVLQPPLWKRILYTLYVTVLLIIVAVDVAVATIREKIERVIKSKLLLLLLWFVGLCFAYSYLFSLF